MPICISARAAAPSGWLTGSWMSCAPIFGQLPEKYTSTASASTMAITIRNGRRVVGTFIVVTLIVVFLSSVEVTNCCFDRLTVVDQHDRGTHPKVELGVYYSNVWGYP